MRRSRRREVALEGRDTNTRDIECGPRPFIMLETEGRHMALGEEEESDVAQTLVTEGSSRRMMQEQTEKDQRKAIKIIVDTSKSSQQLLDNAYVHVEEDWTNEVGVEDFPGNIYSIAAFADDEALCTIDEVVPWIQMLARRAGFVCIVLIQLVAPPAIFMSTVFSWGILKSERIRWEEWHASAYDWHHIGLTKFLGVIFVFLFCLNGLFVLLDEYETYEKVDWLFRTLNKRNPEVHLKGEYGIAFGILVNIWVVVWCCLDSFVVCGTSFSPGDLVYDSLGLIFLFNLDDIGGDLGFVGEDEWPAARLAWMYKWFKQESEKTDESREDPADSFYDMVQDSIVKISYYMALFFIMLFVVALPIFTAITPFLLIAPSD